MYFSELGKAGGYSSLTLQRTLKFLLDQGLAVVRSEKPQGRGYPRTVYSLTSKGRKIAFKLREITSIASEETGNESLLERLYRTFLVHVNVMDDLVRIQDGSRIAEVFVSKLRGRMRLRCSLCDSENCVHVNFSWSLPEIRALL